MLSIPTRRPVIKALDRRAVSVVPIGGKGSRKWEVYNRCGGDLIATIHMVQGRAGKCYSYKIVREARVHKGFGSLKLCVARILEKV